MHLSEAIAIEISRNTFVYENRQSRINYKIIDHSFDLDVKWSLNVPRNSEFFFIISFKGKLMINIKWVKLLENPR